jgi:hypothetical protein
LEVYVDLDVNVEKTFFLGWERVGRGGVELGILTCL